MKQIKELDAGGASRKIRDGIEEKTRTDILLLNTLKDVIERVEKLEETKSDKLVYKLPAINLCSYSLI